MDEPSSIRKSIRLGFDKSPSLPSVRELFVLSRLANKKEKYTVLILLVVGAIALLTTLWAISSSYMVNVPTSGGTIKEGLVGTPRLINPILATTDVDRDITGLVYSGLLRAQSGDYANDLAESISISADGTVYTVVLKDAKWHDGKPVSPADIIFTIHLAQNSLVKSPKRANWEGVLVESTDERTIQFSLRTPYAPFLENLTMGILPSHLWRSVAPEEVALSNLNQKPVGTGPYKISSVDRDSAGLITQMTLVSNTYFTLGKPFIKRLVFNFYPDEDKMQSAYKKGHIDSMSGLSVEAGKNLKSEGQDLLSIPLPRLFGIFYNQNQSSVLSDPIVRKALEMSVRKEDVITFALNGFGQVASDALGGVSGNNPTISIEEAGALLENNGWKLDNETGIRKKKNKPLEFAISTGDGADLARAASLVADTWKKLGANVTVKVYENSDLNTNVVRPRKFDALLIGQGLGHFPDMYAFWHSLQRLDPGLNVAQYTNITVDKALELARKTKSSNERRAEYETFMTEIINDRPALFLYVPHYIYVPPSKVHGVDPLSPGVPSDRFLNVHKWYIQTDRVWRLFSK